MVKYCSTAITFAEVPDEVSLSIQITNCQNRCKGCHSPFLRDDFGKDLEKDLPDLLKRYKEQITCVCFMGEGNDILGLQKCIDLVKENNLKTCVYSGEDTGEYTWYLNLDYWKTGSYMEEYGPLNSKTTNQRMYHIIDTIENNKIYTKFEDITYKFWPKTLEENYES